MSTSSVTQGATPERGTRRGSCFLCGASNGTIVVSEAGYVGRACSCGVVYIDPMPAPGVVNPAQDHHFETYYSLPAKVRLDFISRFQTGGRLLEVGCGGGELLALARRRGFQVAGVEPNLEAALATEALGIEVERSLIEDSTLPEQSVEVVFHVDLLSHFPDPIRALRKMAKLVQPGGLVCFEVSVGGLGHRWSRWVGRAGYPQHLWLYSKDAINAVLKGAGLRVVGVQRFGLLPATLVSAFGNLTMRQRISRPTNKDGRSATTKGFYRAYSWLQYLLRYRVGKFVPAVGPHIMLVAARPLESNDM